jgi:hypothetical protein
MGGATHSFMNEKGARRRRGPRVGMIVLVVVLLVLLVILVISPSWLYLRGYERTPGTPSAPTSAPGHVPS